MTFSAIIYNMISAEDESFPPDTGSKYPKAPEYLK
jgi:hypothetical protein